MIEQGTQVKYRVGMSQEPNTVGTVTYVDDLRVYIDGEMGKKTGLSRIISEIQIIR